MTGPGTAPGSQPGAAAGAAAPLDLSVPHSRAYVTLLLISALLGVPISAVAYVYLQLVHGLQHWVYTDLPQALGFAAAPVWWPVPPLVLAGLIVGLCARYVPGRGGDPPVAGVHTGPPPAPPVVAGIALAALASLGLGAVVGPEAPLIAIGAGLAAWAMRFLRRGADAQAVVLVGAAGSFAAISLLLGSPLLGAFLLMEAMALGGAMLGLVLVPGLLAAGIGALVITGLGSLTGLGTASLRVPAMPEFVRPDVVDFGWAVAIGLIAPFLGTAITWLARVVHERVMPRPVLATSVVGLLVAAVAIGYATVSGRDPTDVLFSGESALGPLLLHADDYSVATLLLLMLCKGLAYGLSLGAFRGGPVFPGMYLGAVGGIALSHAPGLPATAGAAMGIGAMCVVMLRLPLTSVLLATLLMSSGLALMPLVIVSIVVAHVLTGYLTRDAPALSTPGGEP